MSVGLSFLFAGCRFSACNRSLVCFMRFSFLGMGMLRFHVGSKRDTD